MTKKIKEDTSGLVQDMTTWVMGYVKREGRLPSHQFVKNTFVYTFGYGASPLLEQLAKWAVDNVMSMPIYKQLKNKQKQAKQ